MQSKIERFGVGEREVENIRKLEEQRERESEIHWDKREPEKERETVRVKEK